MSRRALITGISGFVGGFLAEHLLDAGDAVLGCSPDGRWEAESPEAIRDRVELVAWDLGDADGMAPDARQRIERFAPDVLYHLAALSVPEDCGRRQPTSRATAVNVGGTRRMLELVAGLGRGVRVLLISSSHVYAPVSADSPIVDEDAPLGPQRGYGQTKLAAEEEVRRAIRQAGCDGLIARAFQHTGPRQTPRMMLPQWTRQFACGTEPVRVYTLDAHLDLSDVRDVVRAYRLLGEHGRRGEVYNVGSGIQRRSGDILELLRRAADPNRPVVELRGGFKQEPIADVGRLVRCTGWRPEIPLERTISDTLEWWRTQTSPPESRKPI